MSSGPASRLAFRVALLSLTMLGAASQAPAQPGERTGPEAAPPTLPPYARPEAGPSPIIPAPATPAPSSTPAAERPIREIRVVAAQEGDGAVPPRAWQPPADPVSGFALSHALGQPLDAEWVRRQFAANIPAEGATVSSAIALLQLVNRAFLTAGFINSGLVVAEPPDLASGTLDLRLIHGGLGRGDDGQPPVTVNWGNGQRAGLDEAYVRSRFPSARRRPLSAVDLERDFRLLAEDPAIRTINADLRPGATPGEASLHLVVHPEERFDLYLGAANDRSPSVGGERLFAGGSIRSLLAAGDLLTAEAGTTRGLEDAQLGYSVPVTPRTSLFVRGSFNNAAVIDRPLVPLDISAEDRSAQAGFTYRLLQAPLTPRAGGGWSPSRSLTAGMLVAWRHQKSFLLGEPFSFAPGSVDGRTEYTALRLTADYLLRNVDQVLAVSATATMGLGGTQSDIPDIPNPQDHFKALLVQVNYARRLDSGGLELRARLTGQVADSILYSGERLSIGGSTSVRGYRENLFLVDNGLIGSLELALPFTLSRLRAPGAVDWGAFTASVFADAAWAGNEEPPPPTRDFIASVGVGLAWTPSDAVQASVTYGIDLVDVPIQGGRDIQDHGLQFRLVIHPLRLFRRGQAG